MKHKNGHELCSPIERLILSFFESNPGATAGDATAAVEGCTGRRIYRMLGKNVLVVGPPGRAHPLYSRAQRDAALEFCRVFGSARL